MIIDINNPHGSCPDGSKGHQHNQLLILIGNAVRACKALSDYETACAFLMELVEIAATDAEAMALLMRGKEEIREFFEKRNTPQPSSNFEGCFFVEKSKFEHMYMDNHGIINHKEKEPEE